MSQPLEQEREIDEPLPERRQYRGPCLLCGEQVDQPGAPLCDGCDDDLAEESGR
jgi:hypothetical protein